MKLKYNQSGVIILIITSVLIMLMFYFPYAKHPSFKGDTVTYESLYGITGMSWVLDVLTVVFWWPLLLILELSVLKEIEKRHIWIFVFQCLILSVFGYFIYGLMELCLMCTGRVFLFNYYIIMLNLLIGIAFNFILVGIIGSKKSKLFSDLVKYISIFKR